MDVLVTWDPCPWALLESDSSSYYILEFPKGSKCPRFKDSGSKIHTLRGIWDQKPQILGTWTL